MSLSEGELFFVIVIGLILLLSVVCNVTVVIVVAATPKLRNPTNVLICNLAVSDLLLASVVLPQNLHDISHSDSYHEGDVLCRVVYACPLLCIMASIYSMVAISFDRTHAIVLNSSKKLTSRTAALQLALIWVMSSAFCIPTMHEHSQFVVEQDENGTLYGCGSSGVSYTYSVANGVLLLLVAYVIPLIILLFNYCRILAFFRSKGMFGKQASERGAVFQTLFKTRMMVVKMLILVAAFFFVSWAPYFVLLLIEKVSRLSDTGHSDEAGNMLKIALSAFSTAYNFVLYVAYNRNFRLGVTRLLGLPHHLHCCRRRQVAPSSDAGDFVISQVQPGATGRSSNSNEHATSSEHDL